MARKSQSRTRSTGILYGVLIFGPVIAWVVYAVAQGQIPFQLRPPAGAHQPTR